MLNHRCTGIQKLIFDRICQIHDEIIFHDPEYRELGEEPAELMKQLGAKLDTECREKLDRFDCSRTRQMSRQDELMYLEALKDGILFGYWVAVIGQGVKKIGV